MRSSQGKREDGVINADLDEDSDSDEEQDQQNLIRGSDCYTTVGASVIKRWSIYKRDRVAFICQVVSPLILIILGLSLYIAPSSLVKSDEKFISTDLYPTQKLLFSSGPPVYSTDR